MKTARILLALVAALALGACDLAVAINAKISGNRVIEGDSEGGTEAVQDVLALPKELESFDVDSLKELKDEGYSSKDIKAMTLQHLTFTIRSGAENFDFVDEIEVRVGAEGIEPVVLIPVTEIERGQEELVIAADPVDLKPFVQAKGTFFEVSSVGRRPSADVKMRVKALFRIEINASL